MTTRLFTLEAEYVGQSTPQAIYGTDENTLRMVGRDHHRAASIKPILTLKAPDGTAIATMDEWADDWAEGVQAPTPAPVPSQSILFFETSDDAIAYRANHGTGGWIFACFDKNSGMLFPAHMTPSAILRTGCTSSMGGRFIGAAGEIIKREDVQ